MITNLDSQSQLFLADMNRVQQRLADSERQLTSGKKVSVASDAPDVVSQLLRLRSALQKNTQIGTNLSVAQTTVNVSDTALASSIQLLDRALTIGAQGASDTQSATSRLGLAADVQAVQEQMISFSRTQSGGIYVFSGDQESLPSYQLNLANDNGVDRLLTTSATHAVENPAGGSFPQSMTAQDIFDHRNLDDSLASDNVFAALNNLRLGLENNDAARINSAVGSLKQAADHLNICQSFYGSVENRIQDATDFTNRYDVQLKTEISQKEDADVAAASLEFSQGTVQLQAAFQMQGRIPRTTLFDYLT
ncbi:MAG: hypothetical protein LAP40_05230 [Acidobacteriia bacterium]|nr:hypothetical protein [Terriglobia bacterium]